MKTLRILMLEDNQFDVDLIKEELISHKFNFTSELVETEKDFIKAIHDFKPDIILSDYNLPQFTGFEALEIAKKLIPDIPFIIVTGSLSEELAVESIKAGAWDYVIKENLLRLSPVIESAFKLKDEKDKNQLVEKSLKENEYNYRMLFDNMSEGIFILDAETKKVVLSNKAIAQIYGFDSEADAPEVNPIDFVLPEDKEAVYKIIAEDMFKNDLRQINEFRSLTKDGREIWISAVGVRTNYKGRLAGLISISEITKRKQSEKILRESERKLTTLMSNLLGMAYRCQNDPHWTMEFISDGCETLTGYSPEDLVGNTLTSYAQLIHPEDRKMVWDEIQIALKNKKHFQLTYRIITSNGQEKWVWEQGLGIFGEHEKIIALEGFIIDITEFIQAQEALEENEERYRQIFQFSPDSIIIHDMDMNILDVNNKTVEEFGYSKEELLKKSILELHHETELKHSAQVLDIIKKKGMLKVETKFVRKDGSVFLAEVTPCKYTLGGKPIIHVVIRDITERKQAEKKIRRSEEQFRLFAENVPGVVSIYEWHPDGHREYIYQGPGLKEILGEELNKKIDKDPDAYFRLIPEEDYKALDEASLRAFKTNEQLDFEYRLKIDDFNIKWIRSLFSIFRKENGVILWQGIIYDITERKQAEETLKQSEAQYKDLAEKGNIAIVVDDIDGNLLYYNKQFSDLFGYSMEQMKKQNHKTLIHPDDFKRVSHFHKNHIQGRKILSRYEFKGIKKDGTAIDIEISVSSIIEKDNKIIGTRSYLWNIIERKQAEIALKESEAKLIATFGAMTDIIIVYDSDGYYLEIAPTNPANLSHPMQDLLGKSVTEVFPPEQADFFLQNIRLTLKTKQLTSVEYSLRIGDKDIWFSTLISPLSDNSVVWVARDITEKKLSEKELTRLSIAVKQSPSVIVITNIKGNLEYVNPKFTELTGYTLEEVRGLNLRILKSGELPNKTYKQMWDTISSGKEWRGEFHNKKKNGELFWEGASISPIFDKSGKIINFLKVAKDITEQKLVENDLIIRNKELEIFNDAAVDREIMINDHRKEINELLEKLGKGAKYEIVT